MGIPGNSKKGMIGTAGIPRDSKKGLIGAPGIPRDCNKGMIGARRIPRDALFDCWGPQWFHGQSPVQLLLYKGRAAAIQGRGLRHP